MTIQKLTMIRIGVAIVGGLSAIALGVLDIFNKNAIIEKTAERAIDRFITKRIGG